MWRLISAMELEEYLDEKRDAFLVDLRDRQSYERAHIQGAVNIPYDELINRMEELPRDRQIILYCYRGPKSMLAARTLSRQGYPVMDVYGGILAYSGKYMAYSR